MCTANNTHTHTHTRALTPSFSHREIDKHSCTHTPTPPPTNQHTQGGVRQIPPTHNQPEKPTTTTPPHTTQHTPGGARHIPPTHTHTDKYMCTHCLTSFRFPLMHSFNDRCVVPRSCSPLYACFPLVKHTHTHT